MIKKITVLVIGLLSLAPLFLPSKVFAQEDYVIESFVSDITLEKNTSLIVKETIDVNFPYEKHGIFRIIPVNYSYKGKTIHASLKVVSITDEKENSYQYKIERLGQSLRIKIGDPDLTITGRHTYAITYKISNVVQRYEDHDEVYWNVTGHEWDTDILSSRATFTSEFADIQKVDCFAGQFGTTQKYCDFSSQKSRADFESTTALGGGYDFTIVIALNKENDLQFPSKLESTFALVLSNWGYLIAILPFLFLFYSWGQKGRDQKYVGDNIYYKPKNAKVIAKPFFAREFLPTVYSPIQGFSPSQVGTIVDEKVDIHDIVGEITELARLGFLKIEKLEKDKLFGKDIDYAFIRQEKDQKDLEDYQKFLLEKLFEEEDFNAKTLKELEKIYKSEDKKLKESLALATENKLVLLSSLKNGFYKHLDKFKEKLYDSLAIDNVFDGKPDKVRQKWIGGFIVAEIIAVIILINFVNLTGNYYPILVFSALSVPSFLFAYSMPKRSAFGYGVYRQIKGLAYYLAKGKWREEIAEKHLFFEEMLPLAISLGIVDKLAKDMQVLGVEPPSYIGGVTTGSLAHDIGRFEANASSTFVSAPGSKWSGSSSWSGGSGFGGGGFSGGGFGGGGGGSW